MFLLKLLIIQRQWHQQQFGVGGGEGGEVGEGVRYSLSTCSLFNLSCFTGIQWLLIHSCYLCAYSSILRCMKQQ